MVVVVFCDNKAPQARIGIWDLEFGILGFGLALAWVWQNARKPPGPTNMVPLNDYLSLYKYGLAK